MNARAAMAETNEALHIVTAREPLPHGTHSKGDCRGVEWPLAAASVGMMACMYDDGPR
jgi:hypothetical protein